jgi:phosphatidylserine/phosphatidylglycerophosphate/cardiolipin synthase-like enzyme
VIAEPTIRFLNDGGQTAGSVLDELVAFVDCATTSLEVAVYDAHLAEPLADRLLSAFNAAQKRGVHVRAIYNDLTKVDDRPIIPKPSKASPQTGPSLLLRLANAVPHKAISGIPDLMHHKYILRDRNAVWTGSANWTDDSWTRQENVLVTVPGTDLAAAYGIDFEQLWTGGIVEGSGALDDEPATMTYQGAPLAVRGLFSPARGPAISELIAKHITEVRSQLRICSPVLTSAEILQALVNRIEAGDLPPGTAITVDGPQMRGAISQWKKNERAAWKVPLAEKLMASGLVAEKPSTPYAVGTTHDYMHAKMVVCDDVVLTGSFNCSHSGEMNAENVLEIRSAPMSKQCAAFAEHVHARYARR